jgi:hypothetical protein
VKRGIAKATRIPTSVITTTSSTNETPLQPKRKAATLVFEHIHYQSAGARCAEAVIPGGVRYVSAIDGCRRQTALVYFLNRSSSADLARASSAPSFATYAPSFGLK